MPTPCLVSPQVLATSRPSSEASDASVTDDAFSPQASSVLASASTTVSEASSDVTEEQIKYVRAHCDVCAASADDATVRRFIRATGGNLALVSCEGLACRQQTSPGYCVQDLWGSASSGYGSGCGMHGLGVKGARLAFKALHRCQLIP